MVSLYSLCTFDQANQLIPISGKRIDRRSRHSSMGVEYVIRSTDPQTQGMFSWRCIQHRRPNSARLEDDISDAGDGKNGANATNNLRSRWTKS